MCFIWEYHHHHQQQALLFAFPAPGREEKKGGFFTRCGDGVGGTPGTLPALWETRVPHPKILTWPGSDGIIPVNSLVLLSCPGRLRVPEGSGKGLKLQICFYYPNFWGPAAAADPFSLGRNSWDCLSRGIKGVQLLPWQEGDHEQCGRSWLGQEGFGISVQRRFPSTKTPGNLGG